MNDDGFSKDYQVSINFELGKEIYARKVIYTMYASLLKFFLFLFKHSLIGPQINLGKEGVFKVIKGLFTSVDSKCFSNILLILTE